MFLNDLLNLLLQVFELVLHKIKSDFGTLAKKRVNSVGRGGGNGKRTTSGRLSDILFIIVVFLDVFRNEIYKVEID
jgi:hypothetical protein